MERRDLLKVCILFVSLTLTLICPVLSTHKTDDPVKFKFSNQEYSIGNQLSPIEDTAVRLPLRRIKHKRHKLQCPVECECYTLNNAYTVNCENRGLSSIPFSLDFSTKILNLKSNGQLIDVPDKAFFRAEATNIQNLDLSRGSLSSIGAEAFYGLRFLKLLDLSRNSLSSIPSDAFVHTPFLKTLLLSLNSFDSVPANSFYSCSRLQVLDLSECRISSVKNGAFNGLNQLQSLKLSSNLLATLSAETLMPLTSLIYFDGTSNPWACDCNLRDFKEWADSHDKNKAFSMNNLMYDKVVVEKGNRLTTQVVHIRHLGSKLSNIHFGAKCCAQPAHLRNVSWESLSADDFTCGPYNLRFTADVENIGAMINTKNTTNVAFIWKIPAHSNYMVYRHDQKYELTTRNNNDHYVGYALNKSNANENFECKGLESVRHTKIINCYFLGDPVPRVSWLFESPNGKEVRITNLLNEQKFRTQDFSGDNPGGNEAYRFAPKYGINESFVPIEPILEENGKDLNSQHPNTYGPSSNIFPSKFRFSPLYHNLPDDGNRNLSYLRTATKFQFPDRFSQNKFKFVKKRWITATTKLSNSRALFGEAGFLVYDERSINPHDFKRYKYALKTTLTINCYDAFLDAGSYKCVPDVFPAHQKLHASSAPGGQVYTLDTNGRVVDTDNSNGINSAYSNNQMFQKQTQNAFKKLVHGSDKYLIGATTNLNNVALREVRHQEPNNLTTNSLISIVSIYILIIIGVCCLALILLALLICALRYHKCYWFCFKRGDNNDPYKYANGILRKKEQTREKSNSDNKHRPKRMTVGNINKLSLSKFGSGSRSRVKKEFKTKVLMAKQNGNIPPVKEIGNNNISILSSPVPPDMIINRNSTINDSQINIIGHRSSSNTTDTSGSVSHGACRTASNLSSKIRVLKALQDLINSTIGRSSRLKNRNNQSMRGYQATTNNCLTLNDRVHGAGQTRIISPNENLTNKSPTNISFKNSILSKELPLRSELYDNYDINNNIPPNNDANFSEPGDKFGLNNTLDVKYYDIDHQSDFNVILHSSPTPSPSNFKRTREDRPYQINDYHERTHDYSNNPIMYSTENIRARISLKRSPSFNESTVESNAQLFPQSYEDQMPQSSEDAQSRITSREPQLRTFHAYIHPTSMAHDSMNPDNYNNNALITLELDQANLNQDVKGTLAPHYGGLYYDNSNYVFSSESFDGLVRPTRNLHTHSTPKRFLIPNDHENFETPYLTNGQFHNSEDIAFSTGEANRSLLYSLRPSPISQSNNKNVYLVTSREPLTLSLNLTTSPCEIHSFPEESQEEELRQYENYLNHPDYSYAYPNNNYSSSRKYLEIPNNLNAKRRIPDHENELYGTDQQELFNNNEIYWNRLVINHGHVQEAQHSQLNHWLKQTEHMSHDRDSPSPILLPDKTTIV